MYWWGPVASFTEIKAWMNRICKCFCTWIYYVQHVQNCVNTSVLGNGRVKTTANNIVNMRNTRDDLKGTWTCEETMCGTIVENCGLFWPGPVAVYLSMIYPSIICPSKSLLIHPLSVSLPASLSTSLSICLSVYLSITLSLYLSISPYLSPYLSLYLSIHLSIYPFIHLSIYPSIRLNLSIYLSLSKSIYISFSLFFLSLYSLAIGLSIGLSFCLSMSV